MTLTAEVCDQLGRDARVVDPLFTDFGAALTFAGPITTLRCFEYGGLLPLVAEEPGEGHILVVDGGGTERVSLIDEAVAETALASGWAGLVVHGCIRNAESLSQLELPVKALNVHPRAASPKTEGERDITLGFGGVVFEPGDWIYGDLDGIVVSATQVDFD